MSKGKMKDLLASIKDDTFETIVENDKLPEVVRSVMEYVVSESAAKVLGSIIGMALPRINGIFVNYKQARFERSVEDALRIIVHRLNALESNVCYLSEEMMEKFRGIYVEWMLDNLYEERQQDKVKYHVNGFINLMNNEANDNLMLMFFNTLSELTTLDIDVLRIYSEESTENIYMLCQRYKLQPEQIQVIKEKLSRLGLLQSRNDEQRDYNLDEIVTYLTKVEKDNKSRNPKGVKLPTIKKPNRAESYKITSLGRSYLNVISFDE